MAKRRARCAVLGSAMLLALLPSAVRAAWQVKPSVELRETWSDNPQLRSDNEKQSQFITSVSPGVTITNDTPRLQVAASYRLNAFAYSDRRATGNDRFNNSLNATVKGNVIQDLLFVDATAGISQAQVSAFGPVSNNGYSDTNRSEVRSYRVSPFIVHQFGAFATTQLRYAHDLVDSDQVGFGRSTSDVIDLSLNSGPSFKTLGWGLQLNREAVDDSIAPRSINSSALANLRYSLNRQFNLTATGGYDKFDYDGMGEGTKGASWSLGFGYEPSTRTSVRMSAGRRYYGNSYFLAVSHRSRNTVWSINYSDDVTSSRSNFLLPSSVDTAAMLSQMYQANFPDPVMRAAFVEAYIRALGLPRSLPNAINYFSNRYALQRQFNASVALRSARTTTTVTLYKSRREALSLVQYDSPLLGSEQQNLNDNTDQTGISLNVGYRLSALTAAALSASTGRSKSLSGNLSENNRQLRFNVSHSFQPRLSGTVEVRRSSGGLALQNSSYAENAVSASLSMNF
ncbi:TIGR03016 family PEP-CTERM system-associated outer membrane protein [Pseudoduganella sp. SL102]|uniref:TIGR03016 family PEP-CTERM system-associated outer membrane protein n=1 Tax=Pseudoduganella sp. SL102 TaxID=2995154 RepID=UPI00248D17C4|nr:TIGR03016 family PEP-CTERM system-associated outer membrane protein [Pseudoduganella sp. SL102]WBS03246.1 TIGR03016 family PEP-CTERM system-associated outer membrane protein [Pseudoduganella sp. SL102]